MTRRRHFIIGTGSVVAALRSHAQVQGRQYRIGYLATSPPAASPQLLEVLREGLRERGYALGRNLSIEYRWSDESGKGLAEAAAELVRLKVELIVAWATPATTAARQAAPSLPIVFVGVSDPVFSGFAASLGRPGGNLTGVSNIGTDLSAKLVQLLHEVVPGMSRLAVLRYPGNRGHAALSRETEAAARSLNLAVELIDVNAPADLEGAFTTMSKRRADAAVFLPEPMIISQRERIAELAKKHRLPTIFARRENVEAGGLLSYGPSLSDQFRRVASYVDKILGGAKPADLPVEQPTKIELVINLKTAKALGLTIPYSVRLRADEMIE